MGSKEEFFYKIGWKGEFYFQNRLKGFFFLLKFEEFFIGINTLLNKWFNIPLPPPPQKFFFVVLALLLIMICFFDRLTTQRTALTVGPTSDKKNHSCYFHCSPVHPIFIIASVLFFLLDSNHHQCYILVLVLLFCLFVLCVWAFVKSRAGRRGGARRQSGPHVSNTRCSSAAQ